MSDCYHDADAALRGALIDFMAATLDHGERFSATGVGYVMGVQDALSLVCHLAAIPLADITDPALAIRARRVRERGGEVR